MDRAWVYLDAETEHQGTALPFTLRPVKERFPAGARNRTEMAE